MSQPQLPLELFRVHCFACPHTVEASTPFVAHDRMEEHYRAKHAALIARAVRP